MKIKLETLANVMIVVTGAVVTSLLLSQVLRSNDRPPVRQEYRVGEKLAADFPVDMSKASQALLLVLSSRCHFCTESMPFYRDLVGTRAASGERTRIVAIGLEPQAMMREYVQRHQLAVDDVATVPIEKIKFRGTPTLVLVDREGTVSLPGIRTFKSRMSVKRSSLPLKQSANAPCRLRRVNEVPDRQRPVAGARNTSLRGRSRSHACFVRLGFSMPMTR